MFSGSWCCLRSKVNHRVVPGDILLNRPSLFPHQPRFTRQQHNFPNSSPDAIPSSIKTSFYRLSEGRREVETEVVEPQFHDVQQQPSQNPSEALPYTSRTIQFELDATSEENLEAVLNERRARQGIVVRQRRPDGLDHRAYFPAPGSTSSGVPQDNKERRKRSAFSVRSTWELALNMLVNSVPQRKEVEGEEIWLSKRTLLALSGSSGANSWVHHTRGGCEVQVTGSQSPSGVSGQLFLRGSTRAVALTREHFALLEEDVTWLQGNQPGTASTVTPHERSSKMASSACEANSLSSPNLPIRTVLTATKRHLRHVPWIRSDERPSPITYDVRSFKQYVEDLTTARAPRLVRRELYGNQNDKHNMVVANNLFRLFIDTRTAPFASTVALNVALAFLCKHSDLFDQTSRIYDWCRQLQLNLQPQTYGYVLRAMLLQDDMATFRRVLDDLLSEGHTPDYKIWLALLETSPSLKHTRTIVHWMFRRGWLRETAVREQVAAEIVSAKLKAKSPHTHHPDAFIGSIDARFGQDWMSRISITKSLLACAAHQAWHLATEIFKAAQKRSVIFDSASLSAIFTAMQQRGSLRDSLDLLRSHFVRTTGRNDQVLIPIIFMTAWNHRFYNVCRVLWRYAAVQGSITYRMQNVVVESLLRNQDNPASRAVNLGMTLATQEWRRRAGKVIAGTDLHIKDFQQPLSLVGGSSGSKSANPMVWLSRYAPDNGARDQQLSFAYLMIHRDLKAWKHFVSPSSERLFKLLSEAYAMDVQWKNEGIGLDRGGKSIEWMIENAIDVPLVKREISLKGKASSEHVNQVQRG